MQNSSNVASPQLEFSEKLIQIHMEEVQKLKKLWYDLDSGFQQYVSQQNSLLQEYKFSQKIEVLQYFENNRKSYLADKIVVVDIGALYNNIQTQDILHTTQNTTHKVEEILIHDQKNDFPTAEVVSFLVTAFWAFFVVKYFENIKQILERTLSKYSIENLSKEDKIPVLTQVVIEQKFMPQLLVLTETLSTLKRQIASLTPEGEKDFEHKLENFLQDFERVESDEQFFSQSEQNICDGLYAQYHELKEEFEKISKNNSFENHASGFDFSSFQSQLNQSQQSTFDLWYEEPQTLFDQIKFLQEDAQYLERDVKNMNSWNYEFVKHRHKTLSDDVQNILQSWEILVWEERDNMKKLLILLQNIAEILEAWITDTTQDTLWEEDGTEFDFSSLLTFSSYQELEDHIFDTSILRDEFLSWEISSFMYENIKKEYEKILLGIEEYPEAQKHLSFITSLFDEIENKCFHISPEDIQTFSPEMSLEELLQFNKNLSEFVGDIDAHTQPQLFQKAYQSLKKALKMLGMDYHKYDKKTNRKLLRMLHPDRKSENESKIYDEITKNVNNIFDTWEKFISDIQSETTITTPKQKYIPYLKLTKE